MQSRMLLYILAAILLLPPICVIASESGRDGPDDQPHTATLAADAKGQKKISMPQLQRRNPRYQLSEGDVLNLSFPLTPEFNQTATVQPDGYITLLGAGDIQVKGKTVPEVTQAVKAAYAKTLHDPMVNIQLTDFQRPFFIAGGEVGHPGKYDLRGDTTLSEAVAMAGGFTEASKHSEVWLFHRVSSEWVESQKLDMKKMLNSGNLAEDPELRPGDMIYVPKNKLSKIRRFMPVGTLSAYFNPTTF